MQTCEHSVICCGKKMHFHQLLMLLIRTKYPFLLNTLMPWLHWPDHSMKYFLFRKSRENRLVVMTSAQPWRTEFCSSSKWQHQKLKIVFIQKSGFDWVWMSISQCENTVLETRELVGKLVQLLIFNHVCITAQILAMNSRFFFMWAQSCRCNTDLVSAETETNRLNMV